MKTRTRQYSDGESGQASVPSLSLSFSSGGFRNYPADFINRTIRMSDGGWSRASRVHIGLSSEYPFRLRLSWLENCLGDSFTASDSAPAIIWITCGQ